MLSEELKRMKTLAGLISENENIDEVRYGRGLDEYRGEIGSYGLEENRGFDIEKTKQPVDLSSVDPHTLEQIKKQLFAMNGEMPTDEELRNIVSVSPKLNK